MLHTDNSNLHNNANIMEKWASYVRFIVRGAIALLNMRILLLKQYFTTFYFQETIELYASTFTQIIDVLVFMAQWSLSHILLKQF